MIQIEQLRELSIAERIQLVEDLWDSVAADSQQIQLSDSVREELDRRIDRYEAQPDEGVAWSSLKQRIQSAL